MTIKYIKNILDREAHNNINENFKVIGESIDQLDTSVDTMNDLIDKYGTFANNIITNGNFSDGFNGYGIYGNDADYVINYGTASLTGKGQYSSVGIRTINENNFVAKKGDKIYIKARMRVTNSLSSGLRVYLASGSSNTNTVSKLVDKPLINQWYEKGIVITIPDNLDGLNTSIYFLADYANGAESKGKVLEIYRPMAINLTETFGAGNEWSATKMDSFLQSNLPNGWFDKRLEVTNLSEIVKEFGANLNKLTKTQKVVGQYTLVDDFSSGWSTTDTNISLRKDERVNLTHAQSTRIIITNSAKTQKSIDKTITISSSNLTSPKMIKVWVKDPKNIDYISIYFGNSETSWVDNARFAFVGDGGGNYAVSGGILRKGWNFLSINNSDAILSGAFSFSKDVKRVRVSVTPKSNERTEVVVDSLWVDGVRDPKFVITFDDAWRTVYTNAYPKMKQAGLVGTTYVIGEYIENKRPFSEWFMTKDMLREIQSDEWCLANHTWTHDYYFKGAFTPKSYLDSLDKNAEWLLENGLGSDGAFHVCYPNGEYDQELISLMKKEGYKSARAAGSRGTHPTQIDKHFEVISRNFHKDVTLDQAKEWVDIGLDSGGTTFLQFHQIPINDTTSNEHENPFISWSKSKFEGLIDYIVSKGVQDKFVTHSEWYDYVKRNNLLNDTND